MKLIIFRHGETDGNVKNIVQGAGVDCPLNEHGKSQAAELRDKLAELKLPVIYCSKMTRAKQTAQIVAEANNSKVIVQDGLEEVHFGVAEGMPSAEAHIKYAEIFNTINEMPNPNHLDVAIPGGETVRQSTERGLKALNEIKKNCTYDMVGVATHGALMYNLYYHYFGTEHRFANCEYFELEI